MDVDVVYEQVLLQGAPKDVSPDLNHVEDSTLTPSGLLDERPIPVTPAEVSEPNGIAPEDTEMEDAKPQRSPSESPHLDATPHYRTKYIMSGHARSISAVKFSPDGTMLASCGECFL